MDKLIPKKLLTASGTVFLLSLLGMALWIFLPAPARPLSANSARSYDRLEVWDFREDGSVRFTILDTYAQTAPGRRAWFGAPLLWNDLDIVSSAPIAGAQIEHRVKDSPYNGQTYRSHSYLIESDQRQFGYSATFKVLPHLHVTGASSRFISIGVYPSNSAAVQNTFVIAVILPGGARDIVITDKQPYKTLTQNARALYFYAAHTVTAHESIHIAYTLTGAPTTDIDIGVILDNSKP